MQLTHVCQTPGLSLSVVGLAAGVLRLRTLYGEGYGQGPRPGLEWGGGGRGLGCGRGREARTHPPQ